MFVYLKSGKSTAVVPGVTLRDGHQPVVGGNLPFFKDSREPIPIEPALWYKTMLIDSIIVDCDAHEVKWNRSGHGQENASFGSDYLSSLANGLCEFPSVIDFKEQVFNTGVYDFDPASSTFFHEISKVLRKRSAKQCSTDEFHITILRLIHCYVLHQVVLTQTDIPQLNAALQTINHYLDIAEQSIDCQSRSLEILEDSMKSLRQTFTEEFQNEDMVLLYNTNFLRKLSYSLREDVAETADNLDSIQNEVNKIKVLLTEDSEFPVLAEKREERDMAFKQYERILTVRENVRNAVVGKRRKQDQRRKTRRKLKPTKLKCQDQYLQIDKMLTEKMAELLELNCRKVKMVSVKEAVKGAIDDLKTNKETFGVDYKVDGSERATDVLDSAGRSEEWMTMEERVGNLINSPGSELYRLHTEFCQNVTNHVDLILNEVGLFQNDVPNNTMYKDLENAFGDMLVLAGNKAQSKRISRSSSRMIDSLCLYGEEHILPLKVVCQTITSQVVEHFKKVVEVLQSTSRVSSCEGRLWMCYEAHIYPKIMPQISKIYLEAYKPMTNMLAQFLPGRKPQDLQINDDWLLALTETEPENSTHVGEMNPSVCQCLNPEETVVKRRLSDSSEDEVITEGSKRTSSNRLSYELSQHSLRVLYERANADGRQVQSELDHMQEEFLLGDHFQSDVFEENVPTCTTASRENSLSATKLDTVMEHLTVSPACDSDRDRDTLVAEAAEEIMGVTAVSTWHQLEDLDEGSEERENAEAVPREQNGPVCAHCRKQIQAPPQYCFKDVFDQAISHVNSLSDKVTVLSKLKQLTKAFRFMSNQISVLRSRYGFHGDAIRGEAGSRGDPVYRACCDDMITVCITLLTYLSGPEIVSLYTELNLMIGLMAPCLSGGVHECSLINFQGAFQYVVDSQVSKLANQRRGMENAVNKLDDQEH